MQIMVAFSLPMSPDSICGDQLDGTVYITEKGDRYDDACVRKRGQFCGCSVMVWAGISLHTKTLMVPIHQNLNAARYQNPIPASGDSAH